MRRYQSGNTLSGDSQNTQLRGGSFDYQEDEVILIDDIDKTSHDQINKLLS